MTDSAILEAARTLVPLARSCRKETEQLRKLPPPLLAALIEAQLFRLAAPRADGGLEASPLEALAVFEELAQCEAAVAWLVWNNTLPALLSRYLEPQVRRELLGSATTVSANSTRPTGRALRERDGFRIDGRWSLVSGCELADVLLLRAIVPPTEHAPPGPPEIIHAYLPRSACRVLDTWHAGGLRGTGSHDVVVEGAWVPASHCVSFSQPLQLSAALYTMPLGATLSAGCASLCLGIASGALRTLVELAATKINTDRAQPLRDQPALLVRLSRMQAQHAAARQLLREVVADAWRTSEAQAPVSLEARARIWQAALHAASTARDIVRGAHEAAGATALYEDCPLERAHRDIHAATQHVILHELFMEDAGRVSLGLAPLSPMFAS